MNLRQNPPPSGSMVVCRDNKNVNAYDREEVQEEEEVENTTTTLDNISVNTGITSTVDDNDNRLNADPVHFSTQSQLRPQSQSQSQSLSLSQSRSRSRSTSQTYNSRLKREAEVGTTKSTFQLALPPPKLHRPGVLRISSLLILQIQQLSLLARRPVPVLEIRRPSLLAPVNLSRDFSRRARLTSKDCYITQIEPYMSNPRSPGKLPRGSLSETEGEEEEEDDDDEDESRPATNRNPNPNQNPYQYHPIVAAIKSSRKNDHHQGMIYLRHGRMWKATTLPNGVYRFTIADGAGSNIMVQCEKLRKQQQQQQQQKRKRRLSSQTSSNRPVASSANPISSIRDSTDEVMFGVRIINQEAKGSVLIGSISRYSIELYLDRALQNVYDEFWTCLVPPVVLDPGADCRRSEDEDWEGKIYTLLGAFGVWMAFREGWAV